MNNDNIEIWKQFRDSNYYVSNHGRVKRKYKNGKEKILKSRIKCGYVYFPFCVNNNPKEIRVHRAVVECFIGKIPHKMQVNHLDGVKTNNHVNNLEICTCLENHRHALDNGLRNLYTNCKLTKDQIIKIRELYNNKKYTQREISKQFNVDQSTISLIVTNKTWTHI